MEDCSLGNNQSNKIKTTIEIADLPEEIIEVILFKLPVKSLLIFRCVSKWWLSLISSPEFVKSHLEFSSRDADLANHRVMFTLVNKIFNLKQCPVTSLMFEGPTTAHGSHDNEFSYNFFSVAGSCNGIICIICIDIDIPDIFLWNPAMRKFKALPSVDFESRSRKDFICVRGFGYSESEDDYKVACIFREFKADEAMVEIYSLRTNSWKSIENFKYGVPSIYAPPKFASGKLHFIAGSSIKNDSTWNIVSLDLTSESYAIVERPNCSTPYVGLIDDCSAPYLGLLGGCLSIICDNQGTCMDVWVLKEYGLNESWTRLASFPYDDFHRRQLPNPLLIMPNGEVMFSVGPSLAVYNPTDSCLVYREINNSDDCMAVNIYFESLVPL